MKIIKQVDYIDKLVKIYYLYLKKINYEII